MDHLEKMRTLFARAMESTHSGFYRNLYRGLPVDPGFPHTLFEWESLPLLSKAIISAAPFQQRIFIPTNEVGMIRFTSGTTKSGIAAIPRRKMAFEPAHARLMPVSRYMGFLVPHGIYDNYAEHTAVCIGGDSARLDASAALASRMRIEGIAGPPGVLIAFASHLAAQYDISHIRHICVQADTTTKLQRAALARLYPNATDIVSCYTSVEFQGKCSISPFPPDPRHTDALQSHPDMYFECVDADGVVQKGVSAKGELVATTLYDAAFPLLRYKTGDEAEMLGNGRFLITGRTLGGRIRFEAGVLLVEELERVITLVTGGMAADFEATVGEILVADRPTLTLSLALLVPAIYTRGVDVALVGKQIEDTLRVSEQRTYAEAVARGACMPLVCTLESLDYGLGRKRRRLFDAREQ